MTPWAASLDQNQWSENVPELLEVFSRDSIFYRMVDYVVDMGALHTGEVIFRRRIPSRENTTVQDNRSLWLPQLYIDSERIRIACQSNGGKVQLHKYDDYITRWRENGAAGMQAIVRNEVAPNMVRTLDKLARNAFLASHFKSFAGGATSFGTLQNDDLFEVGEITRAVKLGAEYEVDIANNPIFCLTSPSALYTIKDSATSSEWVSRTQYVNPGMLINWEMGMYHDIRFGVNAGLTLWNCGEVLQQTTIDAAIAMGDGAPDPDVTKVDGVWEVGQAGATHMITVASSSGFAVGDIVTLHQVRPTASTATAVINGVQYDSPYNLDMRIAAIPDATHLSFTQPVNVDWYETAVSTGLYGYVTKARPVHAAIFVKGPRAVVAGVIQPPETHVLEPIDDRKALYRFTWDWYGKYQAFYTNRVEVYFFAGPIRTNNTITNL